MAQGALQAALPREMCVADLAVEGRTTIDPTAFRMDRPALTDPDHRAHGLV